MVDRARLGHCRLGHTRLGVDTDHWQRFIDAIEKLPTPGKMLVDGAPAKVDEGEWRVDYFLPLFDEFIKRLEKV